MLRKILGAVAGVLIGVIVIMAVQALGHVLFPAPADIDITDPEAIATAMERIPLGSKISVVMAWTFGPLIGGLAGGKIARTRWACWIPGGLTLLGLVMNAFMIPHPIWMLVAGALGIAAGTWLADRFGSPGPVSTQGAHND